MKKFLFVLIALLLSVTLAGCNFIKKTNTTPADLKSDNAVPKENSQQNIVEMEE